MVQYNLGIAVDTGDALLGLSEIFLDKTGRRMTNSHEKAVLDLGGCIASATARALALEHFLKALRVRVGLAPTKDHDLWALYKGLPKAAKEAVVRVYGASPPAGDDVTEGFQFQVLGAFVPEEENEAADKVPPPEDMSLPALLKRNKDAFLTWRYLHERFDPKGVLILSYEFHYLKNAALAVREVLEVRVEQSKTSGP